MNSEDFYGMIDAMAGAFFLIGGRSPNEIWAHPKTIYELERAVMESERLAIWRDQNGELFCHTEFGSCRFKKDPSILPGVIYLDVDAEHTSNSRSQRRKTYHTMNKVIGMPAG